MDLSTLIQLIQGAAFILQTGIAGVILLIWREEQRKSQELVRMLQESHRQLEEALRLQKETADKLCRSFERFEDLAALNVEKLARMEQKVDDNIFCPIVKGGLLYAKRDPADAGQKD